MHCCVLLWSECVDFTYISQGTSTSTEAIIQVELEHRTQPVTRYNHYKTKPYSIFKEKWINLQAINYHFS